MKPDALVALIASTICIHSRSLLAGSANAVMSSFRKSDSVAWSRSYHQPMPGARPGSQKLGRHCSQTAVPPLSSPTGSSGATHLPSANEMPTCIAVSTGSASWAVKAAQSDRRISMTWVITRTSDL